METLTLKSHPHLERLTLGIRRIHPNEAEEMYFHDHTFSELVFILHSPGTRHWAEGRSYTLRRGDVLLLHPGQIHAYEQTGALELVNLLYDTERFPLPLLDGSAMELFPFMTSFRKQEDRSPELPIVTLSEEQLLRAAAELDIIEEELQKNLPGAHLRCFACFVNILVLLGRAGGNRNFPDGASSAETALAYLNRHFREPVSIAKLARIACLSERSLFLRFREMTGCSPQEYRRRKQVEFAAELLKNSRRTLAGIAEECGFCDANHLSKRFTALMGCPPGAYRRQNRLRETRKKPFPAEERGYCKMATSDTPKGTCM